ncbi:uncharacterized protein LOC109544827 [Dendroctonus ponderosae]|uniref:uncharacterized protein LOC109544827 n=1 Tax=Dendroctonus ponderosae TaxID=77166 RepID=UPI002034FE3E|nr:uncharacterized protein LOC109544827 [Dendroctonus ponderosae]XP_019770743.2 uncharacterized protein LOC109544827 [Dendroctonus ponderosae]
MSISVTNGRLYHENISDFPCNDFEGCDLGFCKVGRLLSHYRAEIGAVKNGLPTKNAILGCPSPDLLLPALDETDFPTSNLSLDEAEKLIECVYCSFGFFSLLGKMWKFEPSFFDIDPSHLFAYLTNVCNEFGIDTMFVDCSTLEKCIENSSQKICKKRDILLNNEPSPNICMWSSPIVPRAEELWESLLSLPWKMPNSESLIKNVDSFLSEMKNEIEKKKSVEIDDVFARIIANHAPRSAAEEDADVQWELLQYEYAYAAAGLPLLKTDDEDEEPPVKIRKPKNKRRRRRNANNKRRKVEVPIKVPIVEPEKDLPLDKPRTESAIGLSWEDFEIGMSQLPPCDLINLDMFSPESQDEIEVGDLLGEDETKVRDVSGEDETKVRDVSGEDETKGRDASGEDEARIRNVLGLDVTKVRDDSGQVLTKEGKKKFMEKVWINYATANDHSYVKAIELPTYNMASYGVDTPSDSEEDEIDVVSCSATKLAIIPQAPIKPKESPSIEFHKHVSPLKNKTSIKTIMPVKTEEVPVALPGPSGLSSGSKGPAKIATIAKIATTATTAKTAGNTKATRGKKRKRKQGGSKTPVDKRDQHNDMERQRRVGIRVAYDHLKDQLPYDVRSKKLSKVNILTESTKYANYLTATEAQLQEQIKLLENAQKKMTLEKEELVKSLNPKGIPL